MARPLDGVLLLDKDSGLSSNRVLQQAKRLLHARKAGHGGTLDPLASGLLPLLFGEATKFAQFALDSDKEYLAEVRLGITTDTGDAEGAVIAQHAVDLDDARIGRALERFRGVIEQVPPMYSALKHQGRPLYELARSGRSVERAARRVTVHALELIGRSGDTLRLRVGCSKGTYVRQLAADLGAALQTGAHLAALRRTAVGRFCIDEAVGLEALQAMTDAERDACLLPVDSLLADLPRVELGTALAARFSLGQAVALDAPPEGRCRVYAGPDRLIGVGEPGAGRELRPLRLLAEGTVTVASG
jgi:tRNA pseudouridine55 synthase